MNFNQLFGKKGGSKKAPQTNNVEQTSLMLDQKIKEQELRLSNLETRTNALQDEAKAKLKSGDRSGAKRLLAKRKKLVEQIKQVEGAISMMEEQQLMLQNTTQMKDIMETINKANIAMKEAGKGLTVEDIEKIKEEMDDLKADQEELNNFFKEYNDENLEGVDEELENLEKEMAQEDTAILPGANIEKLYPQKVKNKDEAELNNFLNS